jgi:hypothetical protein
VEGDEFVPVIQVDISEDDPNAMIFSAESSIGNNIDWTQTKWTFMDTAESRYGPVVTHKFPVDSQSKTYTVALTLFRRLINGQVESKTSRRQVTVGSDKITPVVRARVVNNTLILSAEQSEGRGLLLDRAVWAFPGEGDSVNNSESYETGKISTDTHFCDLKTYGDFGFSEGDKNAFLGGYLKIGAQYDLGTGHKEINYGSGDSYRNHNDTFSTSNSHTGPICRRYVEGQDKQIVTLYVYRMTAEGGIEGESITVNVDLKEAKSAADGGGVSYE